VAALPRHVRYLPVSTNNTALSSYGALFGIPQDTSRDRHTRNHRLRDTAVSSPIRHRDSVLSSVLRLY
jgi:hypothetical protein